MSPTFIINVNGNDITLDAHPDRTLLDVLREDLRLTGTKRGCDIGVCGTCTVLIDGKVRRACKVKVGDVATNEGRRTRDEGRGANEASSIVQATEGGEHPSSIVKGRTEQGAQRITTIEGLEKDGQLHPIQEAFIKCGAIQCGFCTPGMVLAAKALLDRNPNPTRNEIKKALAGNLCRCTGYQQIFEAIEEAARKMSQPK